jgi:hypothetical protein
MNARRKLLAATLVLPALVAWNDYATSAPSVSPGPSAAGSPNSALGPPSGQGLFAGSVLVYTLGVQGSITLAFTSPILDGPGTDFIVCENPFYLQGTTILFAEAMYVEVSTDGVHFVRFPTRYSGPPAPIPPTSGAAPAWYTGFAGIMPVSADPFAGVNPLNVVLGGGDAFDLEDLVGEPSVELGDVDLQNIGYVRLVDVEAGIDTDTSGTIVWDCGLGVGAAADVDAVVAVNNVDNGSASRPRVEITLDNGVLTVRVEDTNGFSDVKAGLQASVNGVVIDFYALLPFFSITDFSSLGVTLVAGPIPPGVVTCLLKVAAKDHAGLVGGDGVAIP